MKVLFVYSGNSLFGILPFIKSQADSLVTHGIDVDYYAIKGKGLVGYIKNIFPLRKHIKNNNYDIIHAHYGLCGWSVLLTRPNITIGVSFMGDDLYGDADLNGKKNIIDFPIIFFNKILQCFVDFIIVKSANLANNIINKNISHIVPNGVSVNHFYPTYKEEARKKIGVKNTSNVVLFLGDKSNPRKNFKLVEQALYELDKKIVILKPYPVNHCDLVEYYNSADVFILTSYKEGSPNVIKEAMACNCPIVSTDVGDVKWLFGDTKGCYLTSFNPIDVSEKIHKAIDFAKNKGRTNGRDRIIALGLDTDSVAKKLISIYRKVLTGHI